MPQTEVTPQAQTAAAQTATAQTTAAQPVVVKQHSFATFSWWVTFAIILALFCYFFFSIRRRRSPRHVDEKAGDEGED